MQRNLRLLPLFYVVRALYFYVPYLAPFLLSLHVGEARVLLLSLLTGATAGVAEIPTGYIADMWGRRLSIGLGCWFLILGFSWYATVSGFSVQAILAAVSCGLGTSLMLGADNALLHETYQALGRQSEASYALAHLNALAGVGEALTVIAAIGVEGLLGYRGIMWSMVIVYALALIIVKAMQEPPAGNVVPLPTILRRCRQDAKIRALLYVAATSIALSGTLIWLTPLYYLAVTDFNIGEGTLGWLYTALWAGFLLSLFVFKRAFVYYAPEPGLSLLGLISATAGMYIVLVGLSGLGAFLCIAVSYFVRANAVPLSQGLLNNAVTNEERATIQSVSRTVLWLSMCAIWLVATVVISISGSVVTGVAVTGCLTVANALVSWCIAWRNGSLKASL